MTKGQDSLGQAMSITTKTGDDGETGLLFSRRTDKDSLRIASCGDVDELSAAIGLAKAHLQKTDFTKKLTTIQQTLIGLTSGLANWRVPAWASRAGRCPAGQCLRRIWISPGQSAAAPSEAW